MHTSSQVNNCTKNKHQDGSYEITPNSCPVNLTWRSKSLCCHLFHIAAFILIPSKFVFVWKISICRAWCKLRADEMRTGEEDVIHESIICHATRSVSKGASLQSANQHFSCFPNMLSVTQHFFNLVVFHFFSLSYCSPFFLK